MRTPARWTHLLALAAAAAPLAAAGAAPALGRPPDDVPRARIEFDDRSAGRIAIRAQAYLVVLSKRNGALLELVDRESGARLITGQAGCLWAVRVHRSAPGGGDCAFAAGGRDVFSYRWSRASRTLTLAYRPAADGVAPAAATVTLRVDHASFDLAITVSSQGRGVLDRVFFPADLTADVRSVEAGYAPTFLPGLRLSPAFFSRVGGDVNTYPSRWAFADYLALDVAGSHLALHAVNPPPSPLAPVALGFVHPADGPCSGPSFCVTHAFETWIERGETWTSPTVRVRVGAPAHQTILAYRRDNGIDSYPSLEAKLGSRLPVLVRAPLVKADLRKGLPPFAEWLGDLRRLPSPSLLHPVAFQPRGHDENDPDFLPPDPTWGTLADFRSTVDGARALGHLVMPYLNASWWDDESPTLQALRPPLTAADAAVLDERRQPVVEAYEGHSGYVVSPFSRLVRERFARLLEEWRTDVRADCLFFDQIGARPWRRDFNPASPNPLAYADGWLGLVAPHADRCLMAEDGWDRLAHAFSGFHGGLLLMERAYATPPRTFGSGNWEPYPLALWLLHDKVLMYQHDLFDATMTTDDEVLTWNVAFGFVLSYSWEGWTSSLDSPWLDAVGSFQRALGPLYAGKPLTSYRRLAPRVTETSFGDLAVVANLSASSRYDLEGFGIAPHGFLARAPQAGLVAGVFAGNFDGAPLTPGKHHLIVERGDREVIVRQPLGAATTLTVAAPRAVPAGAPLVVRAFAPDGELLAEAPAEVRDGGVTVQYARTAGGRRVAFYRVAAAGS